MKYKVTGNFRDCRLDEEFECDEIINDAEKLFEHLQQGYEYECAHEVVTIIVQETAIDDKMVIDAELYEELAPMILRDLKKNGELRTVEQLGGKFPDFTKKEMELTLDVLCRRGYLFKIKSIMGIMYGLY